MDKVIIEGLKFDTIIGVYDWEKVVKQTLILDVELSCDVRKAAAQDQLVDALDYASIANRIIAFASAHHFNLMETLVERLAQLLLEEFPLRHVKICLRKPGAIPQASAAGIQIERGKE